MQKRRIMERLEERVLFDAVPDGNFLQQHVEPDSTNLVEIQSQSSTTQQRSSELIVVSPGVDDVDKLISNILEKNPDRSFEFEFLSEHSDGVEQLTDFLKESKGVFRGVHIIAHGAPGEVQLGNATVTTERIDDYAFELNHWSDYLSSEADVLFYGCELGHLPTGQSFIHKFSQFTGTDVAASEDVTGHQDSGGNWELEVQTGEIETQSLLATEWSGSLSSQPRFEGESAFHQVHTKQGQLVELELSTRSFVESTQKGAIGLDAIGFRGSDNYAYGIISETNELGRLGADGSVVNLGPIEGLPLDSGPYIAGTVTPNNMLFVMGANEPSILYGIELDADMACIKLPLSTPLENVFDFTYNPQDDCLYTCQRGPENQLLKISLKSGKVVTVGDTGLQRLTIGALYSDIDGKIYGSSNQTGEVFQFDTKSGDARLIGKTDLAGSNDGFSNFTQKLEVPVFAADDQFSLSASESIKFDLFAKNGGWADHLGSNKVQVFEINDQPLLSGVPIQLDSGAILTLNENGTGLYQTNQAFDDLVVGLYGRDQFTYRISDGLSESKATVTLEIGGEFDPSKGVKSAGLHVVRTDQNHIVLKGLSNSSSLVSVAGDVNNDGFEDVIVGDSSTLQGRGSAYVLFGNVDGVQSGFDVTELRSENGGDGSRGFVIDGRSTDDRFGSSVSHVGDFNGDGIDDVLIGSSDQDSNGNFNSGAAYVVYGANSFEAELNAGDLHSDVANGEAGIVLKGKNAHDLTGKTVAGIGDINGDGLNDVAIAATQAEVGTAQNAGKTYVLFGSEDHGAEFDLQNLESEFGGDGTDGFVINGINAHDQLGVRISGGNDVDGDSVDDFVVSASHADSFGLKDNGQSYLVRGKGPASLFAAELNLSELLADNEGDGSDGIVIHGTSQSTNNGSYVRITDDQTGDGVADLATGLAADPQLSERVVSVTEHDHPELQLASLSMGQVFADNFDSETNHDQRSWDQLSHNVTLHSTEGTRVTIWGDPHVVTKIDGIEIRFDIGYGAGAIQLSTGTSISWSTFDPSDSRWPLGPPLRDFHIGFGDSSQDLFFDTDDNQNVVDQLSALTDMELRELAMELLKYAGPADQPLTYNG